MKHKLVIQKRRFLTKFDQGKNLMENQSIFN
jgi:hypothetical protein